MSDDIDLLRTKCLLLGYTTRIGNGPISQGRYYPTTDGVSSMIDLFEAGDDGLYGRKSEAECLTLILKYHGVDI